MANDMEQDRAEEAIAAAWEWFQRNRDVPFAVVVARAREQCPAVDAARVRAAFEERWLRWRRARRR
jgi:hypothetical protein